MIYEPRHPPFDPTDSDLGRWIMEELNRISVAMRQTRIFILHVEPPKPEDGDLYYADGTDWNPGSGRGVYRYDSDGPTWEFMG